MTSDKTTNGNKTIAVGTRVAIDIAQGLSRAEGVVRHVQPDEFGTEYRVEVTAGDDCNQHRNPQGELWVRDFEIAPLPA